MTEPSSPPLRVVVVALGTRGDVEPAVRLGVALRQRGDQVVVSTLADGAEQVAAAGLTPSVVGPASAEAMWWDSRWARGLARRQGAAMYCQTRSQLARHAEVVAEALAPQVLRADLVVCGLAAAGLVPVLEQVGLPARLVLHAPLLPHPDGTSVWSSAATSLLPRRVEGRRQDLMWGLTAGLSAALARALDRRLRTGSGHPRGRRWTSAPPALLATSPALDPHPSPHVRQTGWWDDPTPVRPLPRHVEVWLGRHPGAVLLNLGSLAHEHPERQVARLVEVARRSGVPAVVQVAGARTGHGWHADGGDALVIGAVDHRALIPRVRAVVHHGGSGTTHAVAAAGRPQVVVPVLGDQPHYGRQVRRTGVGRTVVAPGRGGVGVLSHALRTVLDDPSHARAARRTAERMRSDDGLGCAVRELTRAPSSPARSEASC